MTLRVTEERRLQNGQSSILLCLIGVFILLPLGLFGFELWRYAVAQEQLQSVCDASALTGIASLVSSPSPVKDLNDEQRKAIDAAVYTAEQNSILSIPFSSAKYNVLGNAALPPIKALPKPRCLQLGVSLLGKAEKLLSLGDSGVKAMRVAATYGYVPAFGKYIGLGSVPLTATSEGGLPPVDLALAFDVSGSMDDCTPITLVKRYWDGVNVSYNVPAGAQGPLNSVVNPTETGSRVNAVGPENLSCLSAAANRCPFLFSESVNSPVKGLRALLSGAPSETGRPPGNYDQGNPASLTINGLDPRNVANVITDLVVNLDQQPSFGGWTDPSTGLQFPNVQTLVEAARGNLNDMKTLRSALALSPTDALPSWLPRTAPDSRYQQVYFTQADKILQPLADCKTAVADILQTVDYCTDLDVSLVTYSDIVGTSAASTWGRTESGTNTYFIDSHWPAGGTGLFPLPLLPLQVTYSNLTMGTSAQTVIHQIAPLVATGKSNTAASITTAVNQLITPGSSRPDAGKFILLVSDGEPDLPGAAGGTTSAAANAAYAAARAASNQGIRIICLDAASSPQMTNHASILQQIATLSNGIYIKVGDTAGMQAACNTIAAQMVSLR